VVLQIPQRFKGVGEFSELCPQGARVFVSMAFDLGFDSNLDGLLVAALEERIRGLRQFFDREISSGTRLVRGS